MKLDTLYINQNGMISCIAHAGSYLRSAFDARPNRFRYSTPLDSWEHVDEVFVRDWNALVGSDPVCESCR